MSNAGYSVSQTSGAGARVSARELLAEVSSPVRSAALFLMGNLGESGLSLLQPIAVVLQSDDNRGFLISDAVFAMFGEGRSPEAAFAGL
jgi:hypothetical protein